jgi:hypothetical protein
MIAVITGIDPVTQRPVVNFLHPFLAGKRKHETRVPTDINGRQGWRCVPDGALKPVPNKTQKREMKRYANR